MTWKLPLSAAPLLWLPLFAVVLPALLGGLVLWLGQQHQYWRVLAVVVAVPAVVISAAVLYALSSDHLIEITSDTLRIKTPLYEWQTDLAAIDGSSVVLQKQPTGVCALGIRTNGVGLPRYAVGWFRTTSSRRAFVAATTAPFLCLSLKDGNVVVFSVPTDAADTIAGLLRSEAG